MTAPTNTLQTYQAIGIREDLSDVIWRITPTQTPFMSSIAKVKAAQTLHEWQTQDLAANANNAQVEGDDASAGAITATVRLNNRTQISTKTVIVSGTQRAVNTAGRSDELAYQLSMKALELKRDMETALCQNTTRVDGNATTARQLRGLEGWLSTNASFGVGGAAGNPYTNTAPTAGTSRALTEALVKGVLVSAWNAGGNPDTVMVGGTQKQNFSTFTGNSTRFKKAEDGRLVASIDVYESDFGELTVVANRFQTTSSLNILEMSKWAFVTLRPFQTVELAKTGDADKRMLIVEYTLEARQEKASGIVRDLT